MKNDKINFAESFEVAIDSTTELDNIFVAKKSHQFVANANVDFAKPYQKALDADWSGNGNLHKRSLVFVNPFAVEADERTVTTRVSVDFFYCTTNFLMGSICNQHAIISAIKLFEKPFPWPGDEATVIAESGILPVVIFSNHFSTASSLSSFLLR